ncbi:MAG: tRNA (adenosine(37)-N6)-threonylcarbamoyltransferase complex dimerization subunit type 1 TsaB [Planctomycetota bacterium]|nr:tRNA (adenosine(37)-N6)-threonylcarbamoyltransferase complex dimerization subunit type 1 TsaB [Planctomycetota bacterium]MDA1215090.1 tRNA (adenosine(37)-N6)-threonylcarbamoyltransferase complex dimerization subunit type 1 TsaB [Planctomycetota bacterium]
MTSERTRGKITLGIDTSESPGSLALLDEDELIGEWPLAQPGRRHAQTLIGELDRRLKEFDLTPREVHAVAVSRGPGSFTGLRVGVMCAKTWAYVTGCRVIGIDTYRAIACNAPVAVDHLYVVGDALRGDLFAGEYTRDEYGIWQRTGDVAIQPRKDWLSRRNEGEVVTGPASLLYSDEFQNARIHILDPAMAKPHAEWIARLGQLSLSLGHTDDWKTMVPFYLRRPAAEENPAFPRTPFVSSE